MVKLIFNSFSKNVQKTSVSHEKDLLKKINTCIVTPLNIPLYGQDAEI